MTPHMMLFAFIAVAFGGYSSCSGPDTTSLQKCESGCSPAVNANSETDLTSCDSWKCHIYCLAHTSGISSGCISKGETICPTSAPKGCDVVCSSGWMVTPALAALLVSALLAGVRRSTGLTPALSQVPNKDVRQLLRGYLELGEYAFDFAIVIFGRSSSFERK